MMIVFEPVFFYEMLIKSLLRFFEFFDTVVVIIHSISNISHSYFTSIMIITYAQAVSYISLIFSASIGNYGLAGDLNNF